MNVFKIAKSVKGTQHSGDHGNSDMERKPPTGTRQFGGIEASFTQGEIIEAVTYCISRSLSSKIALEHIIFILEKYLLQA